MKKLGNGWLHKKSFVKCITYTSIVLALAIGYCVYTAVFRDSSSLTVLLFAMLGFMMASIVYMYCYSKDLREFSDEVNKVYSSMDPTSFYNYIDSLDGNILSDETLCKIAFFITWFKHFEGKNDEAREIFAKYNVKPFNYPSMYSLKTLIEIYLLDDKEGAYAIVEQGVKEVSENPKIKSKLKQQLIQEMKNQTLRIDALLGKEVTPETIDALQQELSPFEMAQNRTLLVQLLKEKNPELAYKSKQFVLENSGKFNQFINEVNAVSIDESLIPVDATVSEVNEETPAIEATNEEVETSEEVEEPTTLVVDETKEATISLDDDNEKTHE